MLVLMASVNVRNEGAPTPSWSGKLNTPSVVVVVRGVYKGRVPRRFSPTTVLFPLVSFPITQPLGEAIGSPANDCKVRSTTGGAAVRKTPGVGLGCGLSRSKTCPLGPVGGDWKKVSGCFARRACE